jgi:hypothetical protein
VPETDPSVQSMRRWWMFLIIIVGIAACLWLSLRGSNEQRTEEHSAITKAKYDSIQTGMSYEQVQGIMGEPGEEMSRSEIGGYTTIMCVWKNASGSNMNAMFQNGKLTTKAQFGLP